MSENTPRRRALDSIEIDAEIQQGAIHLNEETVQQYAERLQAGDTFSPVVVFEDVDESKTWLADGFHRVEAYKRSGKKQVAVEVQIGGRRDAVLYAIQSNLAHGLPATRADRRKAATTLLKDKQWSKWSDPSVAKRCGLSHPTVAALRKELEAKVTTPTDWPESKAVEVATGKTYQMDPTPDPSDKPVTDTKQERTRTFKRNGKVKTMKTNNIGKSTPNKKASKSTTPKPEAVVSEFEKACMTVKQALDRGDINARDAYHIAKRAVSILKQTLPKAGDQEFVAFLTDVDELVRERVATQS